jgi:hypothetical protein
MLLHIFCFFFKQEPFRVVLDSWGFKWSNTEQKQLLGQLAAFLPFQGPVSLTAARHSFWLCCISRTQGNNGLPDELPTRWVFGRQVALADRSAAAVQWQYSGNMLNAVAD